MNEKDKVRYEKELEASGGKQLLQKRRLNLERGMSAYFLYLADHRARIKKENPETGMCEQTKIISGEWRALTDERRKIYDDKAVKDKERYEK